MLVNFEDLNKNSRIWIYQSNKEFTENEVEELAPIIEEFVSNWQRHGEDLKASYKVIYNHFIVLAVDEGFNNVSGCSIDASVNLIKNLEAKFSVNLTNKLNISFKNNNNINIVNMSDFQKYAKEGKITSNTIVFNNLVTTIEDLEQNWEIPADKSWHKRFLVQ
ncbi:ABC transporter ATPase [uncultured Lutibacter sp.]|uniref:ABC transporter ATPase n=1 Tax=uncultured Lutibacter sp. TaxID=437739 RepID=UPI00260F0D98|nr:ABC transporter ATPase [uncultured Lutibacter sp.]